MTKTFEKVENKEQRFSQIPEECLGQPGCATPRVHQSHTPSEEVQIGQRGYAPPRAPSGPGRNDASQSIIYNSSYNAIPERFKNLNTPINTIRYRLSGNSNMIRPHHHQGIPTLKCTWLFILKAYATHVAEKWEIISLTLNNKMLHSWRGTRNATQ